MNGHHLSRISMTPRPQRAVSGLARAAVCQEKLKRLDYRSAGKPAHYKLGLTS